MFESTISPMKCNAGNEQPNEHGEKLKGMDPSSRNRASTNWQTSGWILVNREHAGLCKSRVAIYDSARARSLLFSPRWPAA